jgi:hypothetical protein
LDRSRRFEIISCIAFLAISAALGWAAFHTPPSRFDPIGSGRIPLVLSLLLAIMVLALCLQMLLRLPTGDAEPGDAKAGEAPEQRLPGSAAGGALASILVAVLTLGFVFLLSRRLVSFVPLSAGYLIAVGLALSWKPFSLSRLVQLVVVGVGLAYGCGYLFTQILYIRLP